MPKDKPSKPDIPTLREFRNVFLDALNTMCPSTKESYRYRFDALLGCPRIADLRLDEIDKAAIADLKGWVIANRQLSLATFNGYLATLRRALRFAYFDLHLIARIPRIEFWREPHRKCKLTEQEYKQLVEFCAEPLKFSYPHLPGSKPLLRATLRTDRTYPTIGVYTKTRGDFTLEITADRAGSEPMMAVSMIHKTEGVVFLEVIDKWWLRLFASLFEGSPIGRI
jgi:hypothetical protein